MKVRRVEILEVKNATGYKAWFHAWGCEYEEFDSGPGNLTVAIIELDDGSIETHYPHKIKFLDKVAIK